MEKRGRRKIFKIFQRSCNPLRLPVSSGPFATLACSWLVAVALPDGRTCALYSSQSTSMQDTRCYCDVLQGEELLNWLGKLCLVLSSVAHFSAKILLMDIWNELFLELHWITWSHKIFLNYPKKKKKVKRENKKHPRESLKYNARNTL